MTRITYDREADVLMIYIKKGKYHVSHELTEDIILDYDKKGNILRLEILDFTRSFKFV